MPVQHLGGLRPLQLLQRVYTHCIRYSALINFVFGKDVRFGKCIALYI